MGRELLKCVLSEAALARRTLNLDFGVTSVPPQQAAIEAENLVVLVIGDVLQISGGENLPAQIVVCDESNERLARSLKTLHDLGVKTTKAVRASSKNLALDLDQAEEWWRAAAPSGFSSTARLLAEIEAKGRNFPILPDESFAEVYSCETDGRTIAEVFRVLRRGGVVRFHVRLSDQQLDDDHPHAFNTESGFVKRLVESSFYGVTITARSEWPALVENGIEWRVHVIDAFKGKEGPCLDRKQAVIYRGPWRKVFDDDGHVFERGVRTAVCDKTFSIMSAPPYRHHMAPVHPYVDIPISEAPLFHCRSTIRDASESKGLSASAEECCPPNPEISKCC